MQNLSRHACLLLALIAASVPCVGVAQPDTDASQSEADASPAGRLTLASADFLQGHWRDGPAGELVRWESPLAVGEYEFPWGAVSSIDFPATGAAVEPIGEFAFELAGRDLLYGDLVDVTPEWITIDPTLEGGAPDGKAARSPIKLRRESLLRVTPRVADDQTIFQGPGLPAQWTSADIDQWRLVQGALSTDTPGASITRAVGLSEPVRVEIELAWSDSPDFRLALGASSGGPVVARRNRGVIAQAQNAVRVELPTAAEPADSIAFFLEKVGESLVVTRELKDVADVAVLQRAAPGPGRLNCVIYLDLAKGWLIATTPTGEPLVELNAPGQVDATRHAGLSLTHRRGGVRLERLRVTAWNGQPPTRLDGERARVVRADGETTYAEFTGYDAATKKLLFTGAPEAESEAESEGEDEPKTFELAADQVAQIVLRDDAPGPRPPVTVLLHNGARLSGTPGAVADARLMLETPWGDAPVPLPIAAIRSAQSYSTTGSDSDDAASAPPVRQELVRLETDGSNTQGELTGGSAGEGKSCLVWRPRGSENALPLRSDLKGKLVLREPAPKRIRVDTRRRNVVVRANQGVFGAIAGIFGVAPAAHIERRPAPPKAAPKSIESTPPPAIIYLRGGDKLPCTIESIDATGVTLQSPYATTDRVGHEHVKAIELVTRGIDGRITQDRRQELLTLPRMQEGNPPTHLLVSTKGDYLRCRLLGLDDEAATVEVRLEEARLDRARVARIIWLDPPPKSAATDQAEQADAAPADAADGALRVQLLRTDGVRLSFLLEELQTADPAAAPPAARLQGTSPVLGECRALLADVDTILLGEEPTRAPAPRSYHEWVMIPAKQPREDPDTGDGAAPESSPLVGQPAPEVSLPWLAGDAGEDGAFTPAAFEGQVLVLDFWASWCGPCIQAMPVVDKVCAEYEAKGVRLVAVNLQEEADVVQAALERLDLRPRVALDRDGVAAQRYRVTGIPQSVVIGRSGAVTQVLVGSGDIEQRLREAIDAALADDQLKAPAPE